MTFGIMLSAILSGLSLSTWVLLHGYSIPAALLSYPLAGTLGALVFIVFALARTERPAPKLLEGATQQVR